MRWWPILAALAPAPAIAQVSYPPAAAVDTSNLATKADVQAAQTTANQASTTATSAQTAATNAQSAVTTLSTQVVKSVNAAAPDGTGNVALAIPTTGSIATQISTATTGLATTSALSTVQAAIPPACVTAPSGDTLNGSLGTGTVCTPKQDNTRPTAVQAGNTTLLANCTFTITFARAFTSTTPFVYAAVVDTSASQMPCKIQTRSSSGATGVCNAAQSSALTLSALTAATINILPFGTTCTAGTAVMFVGREPSQ